MSEAIEQVDDQNLEQLTKVYLKIRDAKDTLTSEYKKAYADHHNKK